MHMDHKKVVTIVFVVMAIVLAYMTFFSISWLSHRFNTPIVATAFRGDGTFTIGQNDSVQLNNGVVIHFSSIHRPADGERFSGSPVGVNKYPSDTYYTKYSESETGVVLVVVGDYIFLSPKNNEQQILKFRSNPFYYSGAVMKLISFNENKLDQNKGTATISFGSIKYMNFDKSSLVLPIILIIQAMFVFMAEFIIKRRSANTLHRYTFYRSIIYTIPVLLLAAFSDPEWGILGAIVISPFVFIESILLSFLAYKIAIKGKGSN